MYSFLVKVLPKFLNIFPVLISKASKFMCNVYQNYIYVFICLYLFIYIYLSKDVMQGKLFQKCTHLLYCSVLSLGGNVNTRRMSKPEMGSIFHIKNRWNILVIWNYYVNYQNFQNLLLLTSSDTKHTLMHLFLFTNSAQRELVSICTQSIPDRN